MEGLNKFFSWLIDPVKNDYANFNGRATREQFWMYVLVSLVISVFLDLIGLDPLSTLFSLAILIPSLAIGARRLHDINMSGWWQAVALIPILGLILLIYFMVKKGDEGPNSYGAPVSSNDHKSDSTEVVVDDTKTTVESGSNSERN